MGGADEGGAENGPIKLSTYLISYNVGDIVDIKANAAMQRGMPHKYYHGCVVAVVPRPASLTLVDGRGSCTT